MNTNYAGFWLRFVAWVIDKIILGIIQWIIIVPILAAVGFASTFSLSDFQNVEDAAAMVAIIMSGVAIIAVVMAAVGILYHSFFESSKTQGSLGKMALGLIVIDTEGQKLTFGKAAVRNLCKIISDITMSIGYIVAGFTDKKQALHDLIAGTLVVKKQAQVVATQV